MRITIYQLCMVRGKVWRKMRKRKSIIWKRLQSVVITWQGTILDLKSIELEGPRKQKKHFIIAAKLGHDEALAVVKDHFLRGFVSKEDYEAALRGHQAAVDATKSTQRDAAEEFYKQRNP